MPADTFDEISFAVNHALMKYNLSETHKVHERMDWLWRAAAYLKTGIELKRDLSNKNSEKEKYNKALEILEERVFKFFDKYDDISLAGSLIKAINGKDVLATRNVLTFVKKMNKVRDVVVAVSIATGFVMLSELIVGSDNVPKRTTAPYKRMKEFSEM